MQQSAKNPGCLRKGILIKMSDFDHTLQDAFLETSNHTLALYKYHISSYENKCKLEGARSVQISIAFGHTTLSYKAKHKSCGSDNR